MDIRQFYERHARIYDATRRWFLTGRSKAIDRLAIRPQSRVVDFGCGTGLNVPRLEAARPAEIVGVDLSEAMLREARRKHTDACFVVGDIARVDLGRRFDRALCTYALSMVGAWDEALRNMHRHLEPDGVLVVLDFHPLRGWLRPADPILGWWLSRFGVRSDLPLAHLAPDLFHDVTVEVGAWGYTSIVRAARPRT